MKKLLLSLLTMAMGVFATTAANITEDFTNPDNNAWLPSAAVTDAPSTNVSPATNISYQMLNVKSSAYNGAAYLMLYGSNPKAYLTFKLPIACS